LLDATQKWNLEDSQIFEQIKKKEYFVIINKIDLEKNFKIPNFIPKEKVSRISAKDQKIESLEKKFEKIFNSDCLKNISNLPLLNQEWQKAKLERLIAQIEGTVNNLENGKYLDAICGDLEISYRLIKELNGKENNEEILDIIFSKFCLGK
jgi:tRNA modification GTPase